MALAQPLRSWVEDDAAASEKSYEGLCLDGIVRTLVVQQ